MIAIFKRHTTHPYFRSLIHDWWCDGNFENPRHKHHGDWLLYCVRNVMAHGDAREGKWRGNWRMEWVASTLTRPRNVVYLALLKLMRTPRLPAVNWTDSPADLNGLVRLGERRNLVSARVPSGSSLALLPKWNVASLLPVRQSRLVYVQTTQLIWLAFYCSVATPAQVGRCDVSVVKAPWEHTRFLFEVNSLRGCLFKLAWQRSTTRYTVSLPVRGQRRLFAFQMQLLFSDCLHYRSEVALLWVLTGSSTKLTL